MKQTVTYELKAAEDIFRKAAVVAKAEGRTFNNHLLYMLRQNIAYYERVHGKISDAQANAVDINDPDAGKTAKTDGK